MENISLTSFVEEWSCNEWFSMDSCCCDEWSWKELFTVLLMDGPEKHCFLCFFGVVMIAGLVKACFLWFVICGLERFDFNCWF